VLLAALGAGMLSAALHGSPPQPVDTRAAGPSTDSARPGRAGYPRTAVSAAPPSEPVHITISRIGVDADVIPLGVADDGTLEVPPLKRAYLTGWYRAGPTPGEVGNAVIVGHVDSQATGPAVFYRLGALHPGDGITIARADGSIAQFTVDKVTSYPKASFPADLVYGSNPRPGLRLITCGGRFDRRAGSYLDNVVVLASLIRWRSA
jgi:hypothetical protein